MTNGANYKWGKLHHSPSHSDIRTSNQLNRRKDIDTNIYNTIYPQIPIDILDLEVTPWLHSCGLSISSWSKSTRIFLPWSPELYVHYSVLYHGYIYHLFLHVDSEYLRQGKLLIRKWSGQYFGVRKKSEDQPDRVGVLQRILLVGYSWVGTTPSAEA